MVTFFDTEDLATPPGPDLVAIIDARIDAFADNYHGLYRHVHLNDCQKAPAGRRVRHEGDPKLGGRAHQAALDVPAANVLSSLSLNPAWLAPQVTRVCSMRGRMYRSVGRGAVRGGCGRRPGV